MRLSDVITEETKQQSDDKAVSGFTVVFNEVGKRYDYSKEGFVTKGAQVLKGGKLPLKTHTVRPTDVDSDNRGELYATR